MSADWDWIRRVPGRTKSQLRVHPYYEEGADVSKA